MRSGKWSSSLISIRGGFAVGVDIDLDSHKDAFDTKLLDSMFEILNIPQTKKLLVEMDVFKSRFMPNSFDYVTMFDSVEHIPDIPFFFQWAYSSLKKGGYILVDTLPLYYSPRGHHLWQTFTEENFPWVHLRKDFEELCTSAGLNVNREWLSKYLKKATHKMILNYLTEAGFKIEYEHRDNVNTNPGWYEMYLKEKDNLELDGIDESWLFEARIILLGRKL